MGDIDGLLKGRDRGVMPAELLAEHRDLPQAVELVDQLIGRFIVLDEAQNTSPEQMKMFLTRLGFNSKMVITGDVTQVDLGDGKSSGLRAVQRILRNVDGVGFMELTGKDVVRHRIVAAIVEAYRRYEDRRTAELEAKR